MSRLMDSYEKMQNEIIEDVENDQKAQNDDFRRFYKTASYKALKKFIKEKIDALDLAEITDANSIILLQGQRNAYRQILVFMEAKEDQLRSKLKERD